MKLQYSKKTLSIAVTLWIFLVSALSIQPEQIVLIFLRKEWFSAAHTFIFAFVGFLFCLYFRFQRIGSKRFQMRSAIAAAFLGSAFLGGSTELMQIFSADRIACWEDFYFDLMGVLVGIYFFIMFCELRMLQTKLIFARIVLQPDISKTLRLR